MTAQEMLNEANKHFAAVRAAIECKAINWMPGEGPEGAIAYHGFTPGYMIAVIKGKDTQPDGTITTTGVFSVIHLTPEMARVCFDAAQGVACRGCGRPITQEHVLQWNSYCDDCIETGRNFEPPTNGNPS